MAFVEIGKNITKQEELWKMKPERNLEDDTYSVK